MALALHHPHTMAQQPKMYMPVQQQQQQNCVIVQQQPQPPKMVPMGKRPLAPAPERSTVLVQNNTDLRCKRKIQFVPYGTPTQQPASVARRNARERNRVKQVNNGFATLRSHIPASVAQALSPQSSAQQGRGASKKLSKVETLRLAVEYIRSLQQLLDDHEGEMGGTATSQNASRYYTSSPTSTTSSQMYNYSILLPTPTCSEASASPTPSQGSESSFSAHSSYANALYHNAENYENYEPKEEDEELLDAIFSWQQD